MSVKMRQIVEKEISTAIVVALLKAGYAISVDNGDNSGAQEGSEFEIENNREKSEILKSMFLTDEDRLYVRAIGKLTDSKFDGWVYLVYGNDGWDVLSDYTVNLEKFIGDKSPVQKIVDKYAD